MSIVRALPVEHKLVLRMAYIDSVTVSSASVGVRGSAVGVRVGALGLDGLAVWDGADIAAPASVGARADGLRMVSVSLRKTQ